MTHELPERVWLEASGFEHDAALIWCLEHPGGKSGMEWVEYRRPVELTPGVHRLLVDRLESLSGDVADGWLPAEVYNPDIACLRALLMEGAPAVVEPRNEGGEA